MEKPLLEQLRQLQKEKKCQEAEDLCRQFLHKHPRDAQAWNQLGSLCFDMERYHEAESLHWMATLLQPQYPSAWNNRGNALFKNSKHYEAIACYRKAIEQKADYSLAYFNMSIALYYEKRMMEAEKALEQAVRFAPQHTHYHIYLGAHRLSQGNFLKGWPEFSFFWEDKKKLFALDSFTLWDGSSLKGKQLLLLQDQGIGDLLMLIRLCTQLHEQGATLTLACNQRLVPLLQQIPAIQEIVDFKDPLPPADFFAPLGLLPGILGLDLPSIPPAPYLQAAPHLVKRWKERLDPSKKILRVGIAWQGNPKFPMDKNRSIPLEAFTPLAEIPGVQLISLQKGENTEEAPFELQVFEIDGEEGGAFMDTAAIMQNLDLVICSDSSIAHLAGALGVPCWVALPRFPNWVWQRERSDSPWYSHTTLFRQDEDESWETVFKAITRALYALPRPLPDKIRVEISPSELIDRICQLEADEASVDKLKQLQEVAAHWIPQSEEMEALKQSLTAVAQHMRDLKERESSGKKEQREQAELALELQKTEEERLHIKQQITTLITGRS